MDPIQPSSEQQPELNIQTADPKVDEQKSKRPDRLIVITAIGLLTIALAIAVIFSMRVSEDSSDSSAITNGTQPQTAESLNIDSVEDLDSAKSILNSTITQDEDLIKEVESFKQQ